MEPTIQAKFRTIEKVSVVLRRICQALLVMIVLAGLGSVVCVATGIGGVSIGTSIFTTGGLTLGVRLLLSAVTALAFGAWFYCFYHLLRLFTNYARGEILTRDSVKQLRQFGIGCLLWGVTSFLWVMALSVSGPKTFQGHADSIVIGAIIIAVAWFMDIAVDLREDHDLTI